MDSIRNNTFNNSKSTTSNSKLNSNIGSTNIDKPKVLSTNKKSAKKRQYTTSPEEAFSCIIVNTIEELNNYLSTIKDYNNIIENEGLNKIDYLIEKSFNIKYYNNFVPENQDYNDFKIKGYEQLKVFIFLTPITWFPLFKISYKSKQEDSDDIQELLLNTFNNNYLNTNEELFKTELNKDLFDSQSILSECQQINSEKISDEVNLKVYLFKCPEEKNNHYFHVNLQGIIPLFIQAASEIPLQYNHWFYYLLIKETRSLKNNTSNKNEDNNIINKYSLVGFSSLARFHMSINTYRSMISQFFIYPEFQRNNYGFKLLYSIKINEALSEKCIDISTEDPADEYIYLRDAVLFKLFILYYKEKLQIKNINIGNIKTIDDYNALSLTEEDIKIIKTKHKISKNLIRRLEIITKNILINSNKELESIFYENLYDHLMTINKELFIDLNSDRNPVIIFEDDKTSKMIKSKDSLQEKSLTSNINIVSNLQKYSDEFNSDIDIIRQRCNKILNELTS